VPYRTLDYEWGGGGTYRNIEVELPGRDLATEIHAAGAHYDAVWGSPGADDNAAGAAAIVELATVMAGCSYRRTVRLLLLSNEEAGTVGSSVYAQDAAARGDDIRAFLSLDMIAYGPPGEDLDVVTRPPYSWLAERVVDASLTEAGFPAVARIHEACGCGDEGPFWSEGYSAVFLIEDYIHGAANPTGNPHYESPTDTPDTLNLELGTGITRAAAAALAVLADE
jgi:Zn-dependent M28 family amino/carboxypeptidase